MTLIEKLNSINRPPIPSLPTGSANSMDELKGQLLTMYKVDKNIVLQWHKLLLDYVKMDHPMLAIRGFCSAPKGSYDDLRRGFLTQTENFSYFHTDNYFAAYFLKMCIDGYVPELVEFYELMSTRQFPSRFGQITTNEKDLMAIKQGKDPGINLAGFKLAHIIPVGKEYLIKGRVMGIQEILNKHFPVGKRADWKLRFDTFGTYHMRELDETSPDMKKIAIAHFLRFVHPFNYFVCPKKNCEVNIMCKELAEYQPLLDNMHDYMLQTYGDAYKEYLSYILVDDKYSNIMHKEDGNVKVIYGQPLQYQPDIREVLRDLLDGTISIADPNPDHNTDPTADKHMWTYYEDEFCVRMVFYNYVQHQYHDVEGVIAEIYEHLNGKIKAGSIRMKLSNIQHLLSEEHISNSLSVNPLCQVSSQCREAFKRVYAEYKRNGYRIADPMTTKGQPKYSFISNVKQNEGAINKTAVEASADKINVAQKPTYSNIATPTSYSANFTSAYRYKWTYQDDEFCVRMVIYNFIYHHSHDVQGVVSQIYDCLGGKIKRSSIQMKLSNIKYLLDEKGISSSLPDSSLWQVSYQCRRAFDIEYEKYKKRGYQIGDPTKSQQRGDYGDEPYSPPLPTYKIKVVMNGEIYYYRYNTFNTADNLIKNFGYLLATPLYEVESKLRAQELRKQYPSAIIEIVENVTK